MQRSSPSPDPAEMQKVTEALKVRSPATGANSQAYITTPVCLQWVLVRACFAQITTCFRRTM